MTKAEIKQLDMLRAKTPEQRFAKKYKRYLVPFEVDDIG
jgi:hypothetical protein